MAIAEQKQEDFRVNPEIHEICTHFGKDYPNLEPMMHIVEEDAGNEGITADDFIGFLASAIASSDSLSQEEFENELRKVA